MMLILLVVLVLAISRSNATCYDTSGNEHDTFFPCNASAEVSVCCSDSDYCLDNGLCLDAAGDNIFTVQGCTSNTWEAPCMQYCPNLPPTENWYQDLTLCKTNDRVSGEYCCGQNASCCDATESYITLPIFKSVYRAPGVAATSDAQLFPSSSPSSSNNSSQTPALSGKSNNDALRIGLGVGLGLGLGLLAVALAFVGWELRKKNAALRIPPSLETAHHSTWMHRNYMPPQELNSDPMKRELQGDSSFDYRP
ncbi:hypothetical protein O1611_g2820 [Lasiodiplodia mahajangana]|uniref:Uncharacterized protein n=1 Tax=Lasiodiplodia mahajangana TaxID=1108764 RepID=A0ACC2JTG9_9PEZI|nr:hypothetical protein O1611_g2820 [Lasiodiplodia mahajangana]